MDGGVPLTRHLEKEPLVNVVFVFLVCRGVLLLRIVLVNEIDKDSR